MNSSWAKIIADNTTNGLDIIKGIMQTQADIAKHPTSIWARQSVDVLSIEEKILCELLILDSTDDALEFRVEMRHQTVSACRRGLVLKEMVVPTGNTRPTRSNRLANVWTLTELGRQKAKQITDTKPE